MVASVVSCRIADRTRMPVNGVCSGVARVAEATPIRIDGWQFGYGIVHDMRPHAVVAAEAIAKAAGYFVSRRPGPPGILITRP